MTARKARTRAARRSGSGTAHRAPGQSQAARFPTLVAALLIVVAGAAAYANSLGGPFIFDDFKTVQDNPTIRDLSSLGTVLGTKLQTPTAGRPLANLSFAVNYAAGGLNVGGYHIVNVGLHLLAALALFGVLRRMLKPVVGTQSKTGNADTTAFFCALVWAIHPLNTEAVDYITQRTELLAGLFYFITLYAAIRAWDSNTATRWTVVAAVVNACGMATKESMVTAPIVVLLYDRLFVSPSFRSAFDCRRTLYGSLAAGWLVFFALVWQAPFFRAAGFAVHVSPWTYLLNQGPIILDYLRLSVWPRHLILDYGVALPLTLGDVWPSVLVLSALFIVSVIAVIRYPRIGFWGVWFFLTLAPASSVVPIPTEVGAERRMYVPLVAVIVLLVLAARTLILRVARSTDGRGVGVSRWVVGGMGVAVVASLLAATWQRNAEYQSGPSIWQTVLDRRPQPRAHLNIAAELRDARRTDEAIAHLRTAAPDLPEARRALGIELLGKGQLDEAVAELSEFLRLRPNDPDTIAAREALVEAFVKQGNLDAARNQLRLVTAAAPRYALGHLKLAEVLMSAQDFPGAAAEYRACLAIEPTNITALAHLGRALASSGQVDAAVASFRRALELYPSFDEARQDLVSVLLSVRRFPEAEADSRLYLSRHADDAEMHNSLGIALIGQGKVDDAAQQFSEALRLRPGFPEARENLLRASVLGRSFRGGAPAPK